MIGMEEAFEKVLSVVDRYALESVLDNKEWYERYGKGGMMPYIVNDEDDALEQYDCLEKKKIAMEIKYKALSMGYDIKSVGELAEVVYKEGYDVDKVLEDEFISENVLNELYWQDVEDDIEAFEIDDDNIPAEYLYLD